MSLYYWVEAARVRQDFGGPPHWPYQPYDDDFFRDVPVGFHEMQRAVLMSDLMNYKIDYLAYLDSTDQEHLYQPLLQHVGSIEKAILESFRSYGQILPLGDDKWETVKRICVEQDLAREKVHYEKRVQASPSVLKSEDAN